jgi:hypothetical protein
MVVFSSMTGDMIDLKRTRSRGVEALKHFLEYAEKGRLQGDYNKQNIGKKQGIVECICSKLKDAGYEFQKDIGHSKFKIDIAVIHPAKPEEYVLGIMLDGESYRQSVNTKDREIGQINVLDGLDDGTGHLGSSAQHVLNGITKHIVKGQQDQHGQQAPQAAATTHGCAFFLLQFLNGFILLLLIVGVFFLNRLDLGLQARHFHGAFFALCGHGQQNQLHDHGKKDDGKAVVSNGVIQEIQQLAKGDHHDICDIKC